MSNHTNRNDAPFSVEPKDRPRLSALLFGALTILVFLSANLAPNGVSKVFALVHVLEPAIAAIFCLPFALWFLAEFLIVLFQRASATSSTAKIINAWTVFVLRLAARLSIVYLLWLDSRSARAAISSNVAKIPHIAGEWRQSFLVLGIILVILLGIWAASFPDSLRRFVGGLVSLRGAAGEAGSRVKHSGLSSRASIAAGQLADRRPLAALRTILASVFIWLALGLDGLRGARGEELIGSTVGQIDAGSHLGFFGGRSTSGVTSRFGDSDSTTGGSFGVAGDDGVPVGVAMGGFLRRLLATLGLSGRAAAEADPDARPEPIIVFDGKGKKHMIFQLVRDKNTGRLEVKSTNVPTPSRRSPFYEDEVELLQLINGQARAILIDEFEHGNRAELGGKLPDADKATSNGGTSAKDVPQSIEALVPKVVIRPNEASEWTMDFGSPITNDKIMNIVGLEVLYQNMALKSHFTAATIKENLASHSPLVERDPLFKGVGGIGFHFLHGSARKDPYADHSGPAEVEDDDDQAPVEGDMFDIAGTVTEVLARIGQPRLFSFDRLDTNAEGVTTLYFKARGISRNRPDPDRWAELEQAWRNIKPAVILAAAVDDPEKVTFGTINASREFAIKVAGARPDWEPSGPIRPLLLDVLSGRRKLPFLSIVLGLGYGKPGREVPLEMEERRNVIFLGAQGSGKSVVFQNTLTTFFASHSPKELQAWIFDPKEELNQVFRLQAMIPAAERCVTPHIGYLVHDIDQHNIADKAATFITHVMTEAERRTHAHPGIPCSKRCPHPLLLVAFEELQRTVLGIADKQAREAFQEKLSATLAVCRSANVIFFMASQKGTKDIMDTNIKINIAAAVMLRSPDIDIEQFLGYGTAKSVDIPPGAPGRMAFIETGSSRPAMIQGFADFDYDEPDYELKFASAAALARNAAIVARHWTDKGFEAPADPTAAPDGSSPAAPKPTPGTTFTRRYGEATEQTAPRRYNPLDPNAGDEPPAPLRPVERVSDTDSDDEEYEDGPDAYGFDDDDLESEDVVEDDDLETEDSADDLDADGVEIPTAPTQEDFDREPLDATARAIFRKRARLNRAGNPILDPSASRNALRDSLRADGVEVRANGHRPGRVPAHGDLERAHRVDRQAARDHRHSD